MNRPQRLDRSYRRFFIASSVASLVILGTAGLFFGRFEYQSVKNRQLREIGAVGELKARQVESWRREFLNDTLNATKSPLLAEALENLQSRSSSGQGPAILSDRLNLYLRYGLSEGALLYTPNGKPIAASEDTGPLKVWDDTERSLGSRVLKERQALFRDLYKTSDGRWAIDLYAPIFSRTGEPLGVLILRKDPFRELFPLLQWWPLESTSAETYLVRREGDRVVTLNPLRFEPRDPLSVSFPLSTANVPGARAVRGETGEVLCRDYRGVPVLAYTTPIADSPWFMISKVDASEALSEAWLHGSFVFIVTFLLFLAFIGTLGFILSRKKIGLYTDLYHEERRRADLHAEFRATLFGIGDGVISTDGTGKIRWLNAVAERLTGWKEKEAQGMELPRVFQIHSELTGEEVPNPVEKVLQTRGIVGLANHTVLRARDGTEYAIADSGAPIYDENGTIQGVVLVFRDVTAERAMQERNQRLSAMVERSLNEVYVFNDTDLRFTYANRAALDNLGYTMEELGLLTPLDIKPDYTVERFQELLSPLRSGSVEKVTLATVHRRKNHSSYDVYLSIQLFESREGKSFVAMGLDYSERRRLELDLRRAIVERETLLRELHHRTKNNLQIVCSLLNMSAGETTDEKIRETFRTMENRVGSIALAHELLYQSDSFSRIDLGDYLTSIINLALMNWDLASRVRLEAEVEAVDASIDTVSPLGLILNELATNSAKYAFPQERPGVIKFILRKELDGQVYLEYQDDGVGLGETFDPERDGNLGFNLIRSLSQGQLRGTYTIRGTGGLVYQLRFKNPYGNS